jgi:hypothetical protein
MAEFSVIIIIIISSSSSSSSGSINGSTAILYPWLLFQYLNPRHNL